MNIDFAKLTQILTAGGASAGHAEAKVAGGNGLEQSRSRPFKASLEIPDSDVEAQLHLHDSDSDAIRSATNTSCAPSFWWSRAALLMLPSTPVRHEAEALRGRFSDCTSGIPFARALREVAVRDPVNKSSADLSEELRAILDKTDLGHLTPPEQTNEGIQMFAVCSKKESKNNSPGMQKMRDEIFQQKFGAKAKRYLAELRHAAMIEYK